MSFLSNALQSAGPYVGSVSQIAVSATANGPYAGLGQSLQTASGLIPAHNPTQKPNGTAVQNVAAVSASAAAAQNGSYVPWYSRPPLLIGVTVALAVLTVVFLRSRK